VLDGVDVEHSNPTFGKEVTQLLLCAEILTLVVEARNRRPHVAYLQQFGSPSAHVVTCGVMDRKIECTRPHRCCVRPARNNVEPQLDQINCRTSFREATGGRESDMIYVICVAALVLAAY
jgi:hypothetical protein